MKKQVLSVALSLFVGGAFAQIQGYNVGGTVADFTVTDIDGNTHTLSDYTSAGKYVILDFFFDTCPPCQQTSPIFNEFHEKYGCNAGDVVAITMNNGSDSDAEVAAFEATYGGSFAHAPAVSADGGAGAVDTDFDPYAYPTYTLIAPDGTMINGDIWPLTDVSSLEAAFPAGAINAMPCAAVGVEENAAAISKIFPNPSTGNITITVANTSSSLNLEVYDVLGKIVKSTALNVSSPEHNMNLSDLENGLYMVKLISGNEVLDTEQVVLNK